MEPHSTPSRSVKRESKSSGRRSEGSSRASSFSAARNTARSVASVTRLPSGNRIGLGLILTVIAALVLFQLAGAQNPSTDSGSQAIRSAGETAGTGTEDPDRQAPSTPEPGVRAEENRTEPQPTEPRKNTDALPTTGVSSVLYSLALVFFLTILNGAFSMAETALVSLRRSRVEQLVEEGRSGATTVQQLVNDPPRFIATVQIGITVVGFASAAAAATTLAAPLVPVLQWIPGVTAQLAEAVAVFVITMLTALLSMVLGEIVPKSLALQAPDVWALRLAPFINLCSVVFLPLTTFAVWLSNVIVAPFGGKAKFETPMITREEFEQIVDQGEKHGELDDEEAKIITNVFDLSETAVRAVMTPRIDMTALPIEAPLTQTLDTILESGHSRIPVFEGSIDNIVGVIHAKDLLPHFKAELHRVDLAAVMRKPYFVPETKKVADLLAQMRREKMHMAIVKDEYSGTAGLVTIEDLLEEIVGEIRDEYDVDEPEVQVLSETESLIDARMGILDVNERLGVELPHDEYDTVGGLVFGLLGHEPVEGERVRLDGIQFQIERVQNRRVRTIRAIRLTDQYEPDENLVEAA